MLRDPFRQLLVVLAVLGASAASAPAAVLLVDARCVDVASRTIRAASVYVEADTVRAVGAPDGSDLDLGGAAVERIDLEGAYLIPALVDLRVYGDVQRSPGHRDSLGIEGARRLALASGVVAVLDVFAEQGATGPEGADWWPGAPLLVARGAPAASFPGARPVDSPAMAVSVLAGLASHAFPLQVVYDGRRALSLGPDTLEALIDAAGDRPLAVQIEDWVDVRVALERGVRWLVQIPAGPVPDDVRAEIERLGPDLAWTPQVALGMDFATWAQVDSLRDDPGLARVLPDTMRDDYQRVRIPQTRLGEVQMRERSLASTFALFEAAGTTLRAGSGAGAVGTAIGFSLVRELEWWVALGVEPWTALRGATQDAAPLVGRRAGFSAGDPADFIVADRSPIEDLAALRAPARVVRAGVLVDPVRMANAVVHRPFEELPDNPLPADGRVPMVVILVAVFTVLLLARRAIRRAAARALAEEESAD